MKNLNLRWATRSVRPAAVAGLMLAALGVSACGSATAREGQGASYPIIGLMEGASGAGGSSLFASRTNPLDVIPFLIEELVLDVQHVDGDDARRDARRHQTDGPTPTRVTFNRYRVVYRRRTGAIPRVACRSPDGALTFTGVAGDEWILEWCASRRSTRRRWRAGHRRQPAIRDYDTRRGDFLRQRQDRASRGTGMMGGFRQLGDRTKGSRPRQDDFCAAKEPSSLTGWAMQITKHERMIAASRQGARASLRAGCRSPRRSRWRVHQEDRGAEISVSPARAVTRAPVSPGVLWRRRLAVDRCDHHPRDANAHT